MEALVTVNCVYKMLYENKLHMMSVIYYTRPPDHPRGKPSKHNCSLSLYYTFVCMCVSVRERGDEIG